MVEENTGDDILSREVKALSAARFALYFLDFAIYAALLSSMRQLAITFGGGPWGWLKAAAIEVSIGVLIRGISEAKIQKESSRLIWAVFIGVTLISVYANMNYEWMRYTQDAYITSATLGKMDWLVIVQSFVISGTIPLLALGIASVRTLSAKKLESKEKELRTRMNRVEGQQKRRKNEKAALVSEVVLEAAEAEKALS